MINYIIQVLLFQGVFLAVYDFFLQKETFFKWNRWYLLGTPFLSFIIPLIRLDSIQSSVPREYVEQLPTVFINPQAFIEQNAEMNSTMELMPLIFYVGLSLFAGIFLLRLFKIIRLISFNKVIDHGSYKLVVLNQRQSAFSFFNYIFINKDFIENDDLEIIRHELVHCKQYHTVDLLFFELLKIMLWFNPMVYVYQNRMVLLHEYISDDEVVRESNKISYFNKLLAETFQVENISFINQFFKNSLIKKRIVMIAKEKSQKVKQFKYLLVIPLLVAMLFYSSCTDEANNEIFEMERILEETDGTAESKYFDLSDGKLYVGKSLPGKIVSIENYTAKEKELYNKLKNSGNSIFEFYVIIDEKGERVNFLKTTYKSDLYKEQKVYEQGDDIPFAIIEEVPIFPGCEGTKEELRICLQEKITEHVGRNFNVSMVKNLGLTPGIKKIFVMFKIDNEGNIVDVKSRAAHKALQEEAIRVVKSLPQLIPGKQKGENVGVKYSLPIAFKVE